MAEPLPPIGAHVPVSGGFAAALRYAADIGAEAIQVFVSNPRSWSLPVGDPAEQAREADAIRDRHENIGAGQIGAPPFGALLRHPAAAGVPFVIETPGPKAAHAADIATLRSLRAR